MHLNFMPNIMYVDMATILVTEQIVLGQGNGKFVQTLW